LVEFGIDHSRPVSIACDLHAGEVDFIRILPVGGLARLVEFHPRLHQLPAVPLCDDLRLLQHHRGTAHVGRGSGAVSIPAVRARRPRAAHPHDVPHSVLGRPDLHISGKPLLLTAELHCSAYLGVCQEAPAGLASERIPRVLLLELQIPVHLQSAQGRGLGDRPHHGRCGRCAHILRTAPKVAERTRRLVEVAILDHQIPEACIRWSAPEAMDSGLVAKFHV